MIEGSEFFIVKSYMKKNVWYSLRNVETIIDAELSRTWIQSLTNKNATTAMVRI